MIDADRAQLNIGQDSMENTQLLLLSHKLVIDQILFGSELLETEIAELLEKVESSHELAKEIDLDSALHTVPVSYDLM